MFLSDRGNDTPDFIDGVYSIAHRTHPQSMYQIQALVSILSQPKGDEKQKMIFRHIRIIFLEESAIPPEEAQESEDDKC